MTKRSKTDANHLGRTKQVFSNLLFYHSLKKTHLPWLSPVTPFEMYPLLVPLFFTTAFTFPPAFHIPLSSPLYNLALSTFPFYSFSDVLHLVLH